MDKHLFKALTRRQLSKLTMDELVNYRKHERAYLLDVNESQMQYKLKEFIHPLLLTGLRIFHRIGKITISTKGSVTKTKRPIIIAATHIGLYDVEVVLQAVKLHAYILSGDEESMYRTFDGLLFDANGVIYVDPADAEDKHVSLQTSIKFLKKGRNILWYPEGTWNLNDNYVVLPLRYGIIEAAVESNAVIVPVGLEQYDGKSSISFTVNIGDAFDPKAYFDGTLTKEKKIELVDLLRSEMARLKLDTWDAISRADIKPGYWDDFVAKRLREWPVYTMDVINSRVFNTKSPKSDLAAFFHLTKISVNSNNAFLARIKREYLEEIRAWKTEHPYEDIVE